MEALKLMISGLQLAHSSSLKTDSEEPDSSSESKEGGSERETERERSLGMVVCELESALEGIERLMSEVQVAYHLLLLVTGAMIHIVIHARDAMSRLCCCHAPIAMSHTDAGSTVVLPGAYAMSCTDEGYAATRRDYERKERRGASQ